MAHSHLISTDAATLIIKSIFNALTPEDSEQFDDWLSDDDNMQSFEILTNLYLPFPKWPDGIERDEKAVWRFNLHAEAIVDSLDGEITPEQQQEVSDWLAADPTNPHLYEFLNNGDMTEVQQWIDRLPLLWQPSL